MRKREIIGNAISEFAPIVTFVGVSETLGFEPALKALVVVALLSLILSWMIERRVPKFGLIASSTIFVFGVLSIVFDDPFYIIIKDTLYEFIFAVVLLVGLFLGKSYLKSLFGDFFAMSERGWKTLTIRWIIFFFLLAISNEIARRVLEPEGWVVYKFIAVLVTWVFGFYQFTLVRRERLPESTPWGFPIRKQK